MKVYIAGASKEITRAERWAKRLTEFDITVTSSWMANIRAVGHNNPKDAPLEDYVKWSQRCLDDVRDAGVLWLLLPECDTVGAYVELGYGHAIGRLIVASGAHRSIFTPALAKYHSPYDAEIADFLRRLAKADRANEPTPPFKIDGVGYGSTP